MTKQSLEKIADLIVGSAFSNVHSIPSVFSPDFAYSIFEDAGPKMFNVDGFPYPYNVKYKKDIESPYEINETIIEFALAGFSESDIDIQIIDDELVISINPTNKEYDGVEYVRRGISKRKATARFSLSGKIDKTKISSSFKNGLLSITIPMVKK